MTHTTLGIPQAQVNHKSRSFPWELHSLTQARILQFPAGTRTQVIPVANTTRHVSKHMASFLINKIVLDT